MVLSSLSELFQPLVWVGNMVFVLVIKGIGVARILANVEVNSGKPAKLCITAECGELKEGDDWGMSQKIGLVTVIQLSLRMQV